MSSLMTIGDFSRAVRMTAKTLRFYHENGILVPALVDDQNGYRRYAAHQIPDAQIIRTLRGLHVPVNSIRELVATSDVAVRAQLLADHLQNMEQQLEDAQVSVQNLRDLLATTPSRVEIAYRSVPEARAVAISEMIELRDLGEWFRQSTATLQRIAGRMKPAAIGSFGGLWPNELFANGRGLATVFLTVDEGRVEHAVDGDAAVIDLPAVELAVATHDGPDETVPQIYAALGAHVANHELLTDAPVREIYLEGFPGIDAHCVTEIGWPIFRLNR